MSNYVNRPSNQNRYNDIAVQGSYAGFNTAKTNYGLSSHASGSFGYVNNTGIQYLGGIQASAGSLQKALNSLSDPTAFDKMLVVSSSAEHLTIHTGSSPLEDWTASAISIHQLAYGQENKSDGMRASDFYEGGLDYQQFELELDGRRHPLFVEVQAGDTNKTVQEKISASINSAKLGVSASVSTAHGISTLFIRSNHTGDSDANRFQLRDVTGALMRATAADTIHQDAQDAAYLVDGGALRTSSTNEVSLGNGIIATLRRETGSEPVTITKEKDTAYLKEQINDLVKSFQDLYRTGQSYVTTNPKLLGDLIGAYNSYYKDLADVGITMNDEGLVVNEKTLDTAIENGKLYNLMTDYGRGGMGTYGFAGNLSAIATGVRFNTGAYTSSVQGPALGATQAGDSGSRYNWLDQMGSATGSPAQDNFDLTVYNNYMSLGYFMNMLI